MFRLHYATPEPVKSLPEVEAALAYFREVNDSHDRWANFNARHFEHELIIEVNVGYFHHRGTPHEIKERPIKTRRFYDHKGKVGYYDVVHS